MAQLDVLYARLLSVGFVVMRSAMESGDRAWLDVEMELLHNVPSLIGEGNVERHKYFWYQERPHYVEWVSAPGREIAYGRMTAYYQPIWQEMQTLITRL